MGIAAGRGSRALIQSSVAQPNVSSVVSLRRDDSRSPDSAELPGLIRATPLGLKPVLDQLVIWSVGDPDKATAVRKTAGACPGFF